ncbi:hypothetical protein Tsubulata_036684, partial [Turnera subulata]
LINEAAKAGLALPYTPYWWGLTIGGLLSTGAHGSSLWGKGSAIHDYVVELTIVSPGQPEEGYAKVRRLDEHSSELDAARVSLGVLGVISKVTLKLQHIFKRSITLREKNDSDVADQVVSFGSKHEFADIAWYPSQRKAVYRIDDRVPSSRSGNGLYDYIPFRSSLTRELAAARTTEENQETDSDANGKCLSAKNRLQSSGTCLDSREDSLITACPWDPRIKGEYFFLAAFSIRLPVAKSFIQDVQKLVTLEPKALCVLGQYNGVLIRYVKGSSAYL